MITQTPMQLALDLERTARLAPKAVRPAVQASAKAIRDDWRRGWRAIRSKPKLAWTITSTVSSSFGQVEAEIGVDKRMRGRGGSMAHILEFGSVNNPPQNVGGQALVRQAPVFYAEMLTVAAALLGRTGIGTTAEFSTRDAARFNS